MDMIITGPELTTRPQQDRPDSSRIAELLFNADTLQVHGEKSLARVLVYEALKIDSRNPQALKRAAGFLNMQNDWEQLIHLHLLICEQEASFESHYKLANIYYLRGMDDLSLKSYHCALSFSLSDKLARSESSAELFEVYKNVGNILTRAGDYEGAEEFYHKAFTLQPESDILLVNLGTLFVQKNDFSTALERFRSAVDVNAKNDKAWVGLALSHQNMGDFQLANANMEKALDLNPLNRTAVHIYANWCARDGRYLTAIGVLQNYLSSVNLDNELSLVLIHFLCKTNQFNLAKLEAERSLLWNPENAQMAQVLEEITKGPKT